MAEINPTYATWPIEDLRREHAFFSGTEIFFVAAVVTAEEALGAADPSDAAAILAAEDMLGEARRRLVVADHRLDILAGLIANIQSIGSPP